MNIYNSVLLNRRPFRTCTETTIQITRKDNKATINMEDVAKIFDKFKQISVDKNEKNWRCMIRANTLVGYRTLKGYTSDLNEDFIEDYFQNTVQNSTKFENMSQLQITIIKDN